MAAAAQAIQTGVTKCIENSFNIHFNKEHALKREMKNEKWIEKKNPSQTWFDKYYSFISSTTNLKYTHSLALSALSLNRFVREKKREN